MATGNVNLKIGSGISYNIVGGSIIGTKPRMQTIKTLDGVTYAPITTTFGGPLLDVNVSEITDFVSIVNKLSAKQTIKMTNNGTSTLNVTDVVYSQSINMTAKLFFSSNDTIVGNRSINIAPGSTATFEIAYIGSANGPYNNYFVIVSNSRGGYYKVNTHQVVQETRNISISPTSFSTTTTSIGEKADVTYTLVPIFNEVDDIGGSVDYTASVSGSKAWSIVGTGTNSIVMEFDSWEVNNLNGTYTSQLTVLGNGTSTVVTNVATVNIDYDLNKNLGTWLSSSSTHIHNSIIGISYDLEKGEKYLTIGVGMGGNGFPLYDNGGAAFLNMYALGLGAGTLDNPYPFWAEVCKIKLTGNAETYYSGEYIVKTTPTVSYMNYFGEYLEPGTMFIVKDDGYGSLTIELNHLRELSDDNEVNVTLHNLTRAFYYDPAPTATTTELFIGFNYNTRDEIAIVNTSIVPLPV